MRAERSARVFYHRNKPRLTQIATIRRFCSILSCISLPFEIFRSLNALFTEFICGTESTRFPSLKQAQTHANCNHSSILKQIKLYFSPVWDISTFKRSFHCILYAERSPSVFQLRNKPTHTQIATIGRCWRKLFVISLKFQIFRRLNAFFTALYVQNVVHSLSSVETSQDRRKPQSFVDFEAN